MKRFYPLLFAGIALCSGCDTDSNIKDPNETYFVKYYGQDGNQRGVDLLPVEDGNFILLGNTQFNGASSIFLVKVDAKGDLLWQKVLEGTAEIAVDMEPTLDGNYIIAAEIKTSEDNSDVKLIVVSPEGQELRSSVYGTPGGKNDIPKSVTPLRDGGYIVTGITIADFNPKPDVNTDLYSNFFHFRCNASLVFSNSNWYELFGASANIDGALKTIQDPADNFYIFGYSDQKFKTEQQGNMGQVYYRVGDGGTPDSEIATLGKVSQNIRADNVHKVPLTYGGGYLITGTVLSTDGTASMHASRIREELQFDSRDTVFVRRIPILNASVEGVSGTLSLAAPQGFLLLGNELRSSGSNNISLSKIDQSGQLIWTLSLGSEEEEDEGAAVIENGDGKIMVLGTVELGNNQTKMALFKLNSTGRLQD